MTSPTDGFGGKVALVTGASGELGRAYAKYLARHGARIAINDVDVENATHVAEEIQRSGGIARVLPGVMSDADVAEEIVSQAVEEFGGIDILVNGGGVMSHGLLASASEDQIRSAIDSHVYGTIFLSRAGVREMTRTQTCGRIVNSASSCAVFGLAGFSIFAAATGAVVGFTRSLAQELTGTEIKANCIAPWAATEWSTPILKEAGVASGHYSADLVAPVVAFLCHERCKLNGELLSAGGGRVARIFVSTVAGFLDPELDHEEIGLHLTQITSTDHATIPSNATDELLLIDV